MFHVVFEPLNQCEVNGRFDLALFFIIATTTPSLTHNLAIKDGKNNLPLARRPYSTSSLLIITPKLIGSTFCRLYKNMILSSDIMESCVVRMILCLAKYNKIAKLSLIFPGLSVLLRVGDMTTQLL